MTKLSPATQLATLLTARWAVNGVKPLTNSEFLEFRRWLGTSSEATYSLLTKELTLNDCPLDPVRVKSLLERGLGVFQPLDRWLQAGIWVRSWSDEEYPSRFKRLRVRAPALIFGYGNPEAFTERALAIVGSRDASDKKLANTEEIGKACALEHITVVSGGARGVDSVAMNACINAGGTSVGILADSLLKESGKKTYRDAILENRLCLMSEVNPEAHFDVGNAMSRNRLAYACAEATLVVECEFGKGGTWQGAMEALRENKTVYILRGAKAEAQLIELGAISIEIDYAAQPARLITEIPPSTLKEASKTVRRNRVATGTLSLFDRADSGAEG